MKTQALNRLWEWQQNFISTLTWAEKGLNQIQKVCVHGKGNSKTAVRGKLLPETTELNKDKGKQDIRSTVPPFFSHLRKCACESEKRINIFYVQHCTQDHQRDYFWES